ncbi:MAG: outer membrane beta-barrel protein [Labilithrix sp.]|nr:outer membrane beta-barrel protein [Labilithrix sp.]
MRRASSIAASFIAALLSLFGSKIAHADPSTTTIEQGYELGEIQHPRTVAMAGAQQAFGGSTSAMYVNPANLPLYRIYHIEALGAFSPQARRQSYGAAIADSSTSRLAGGFGGTWSQMDPDGIKRQFTDLRLTLAYPLGDRVSLGLTTRYLRVSQRVSAGPLGASLASDGTREEPIFSEFTIDAGAAFQLSDNIRIGISGRNLTAPGTALAPLGAAGGIGWSNGTVTVEVDGLVDFNTFGEARGRGMAGGEFLIADRFPVRLGYRYDDAMKTHALGFGFGYVDRKFSVDLGGRQDLVAEHRSTMISLGLRFFIDSGAGAGDTGESY